MDKSGVARIFTAGGGGTGGLRLRGDTNILSCQAPPPPPKKKKKKKKKKEEEEEEEEVIIFRRNKLTKTNKK